MVERYGSKILVLGAALPHANGGCSLTAQQPYNNVFERRCRPLRRLGGTQSLHTNSSTKLGAPNGIAATIACERSNHRHETGVTKPSIPSAALFCRTPQRSRTRAWEYIERIDAMAEWSQPSSAAIRSANRRSLLPLPDGARQKRKDYGGVNDSSPKKNR